jgi:predicted MPP superfamily phosphohydrolase
MTNQDVAGVLDAEPQPPADLPAPPGPARPTRRLTRRRFLQGIAALAGTLALGAGYARYVEPHWVDVEFVPVPVPGLPPALEGRRFAQISDIHLGAYFTSEQLLEAIGHVNHLGVEWLMLTGDYATPRARRRNDLLDAAAAGLVEPLRAAQVPVYSAIGNHDLWGDIDIITRYLDEAGTTILRNSGVEAAPGLWLGAVDDVWSGRPDLRAALRDAPHRSVNLLIAHEPDYFDTVQQQDAPVVAQFSGHSHGGQVRLPTLRPMAGGLYSYAPIVPEYSERYPIGLHRAGNRMVYTNRGLGCWPVPFRINCRPEITVYELQPSHGLVYESA